MNWLNPEYLWLLIAAPVTALLFLAAAWQRVRIRNRFGDLALVKRLAATISVRRRRWKAALLVTCVVLLTATVAGPQVGTRLREVKREGIDLVIALDVSASMLAEDVAPNRLERARGEIKKLLHELRGNRVGLVMFAGDAFLQCPLTTDFSAFRLFLDIAGPDLLSTPGTDFSVALKTAFEAFDVPSGEGDPTRALLIVSDGENHVPGIDNLLENAQAQDIVIYAAGVGDLSGAPIPLDPGRASSGYRKDRSGQIIHTRLEEEGLKALASDGAYFQILRTSSSLSKIIPALDRLERGDFGTEEFEEFDNKYQWPLALTIVLLLVEALIPDRRKRQ